MQRLVSFLRQSCLLYHVNSDPIKLTLIDFTYGKWQLNLQNTNSLLNMHNKELCSNHFPIAQESFKEAHLCLTFIHPSIHLPFQQK